MTFGQGQVQPVHNGLIPGQRLLKRQLQRIAREKPHLLPKACLKAFEDAAGETQVERAAIFQGAAQKYRIEIEPIDRHRALAMIRDTVDGKPDQAIDIDGVPTTQVVILNGVAGIDVTFPADIQRLIEQETADDREPVDLDDQPTEVPIENGEDEDL